MKIFNNWVKFILICLTINELIIIGTGYLSYKIIYSFNHMYYIGAAELEYNLFVTNIFITAPISVFLIKITRNVHNHWLILFGFQIVFMIVHQIIRIGFLWHFPESLDDFDWWNSFFYDIKFVIPQVIIVITGIYYNQLIIGKKLLSTLYKRNAN